MLSEMHRRRSIPTSDEATSLRRKLCLLGTSASDQRLHSSALPRAGGETRPEDWSCAPLSSERAVSMADRDLEHWVCTENIARFQVELRDQRDEAKRLQLNNMLSRELAKLHHMFPD